MDSRLGWRRPVTFLIPFIFCMAVIAQNTEVELRRFDPGDVQYKGFSLHTDKSVRITAVGAGGDKTVRRTKNNFVDPMNMFAYAWILDAHSRELIWRMTPNNTESDWWGEKYIRKFSGEVSLKKGEYEVYYGAFRPLFLETNGGYFNLKRLWEKVFGDDDWWRENSEQWYIKVSLVDEVFDREAVEKYQRAIKNNSIVSLTEVKDSEALKKGFSLKKGATLELYAFGEGDSEDMYDYFYIVDAESRERTYIMEYKDTEHAGGALKNRMVRKTLKFNAGDYLVYYQTDDSHAHNDWNANPPLDPNFYGVTLRGAGSDFDQSIVYKFDESDGDIIIKLDHLGDYEEVYEGFKLDRPLKIRIYALGEGRNGEMFDYGWIEDVRTGQRVWEMEYRLTEHAGGADKNRRYDNTIQLPAGSYMVHFVTDDSHSYRNWNSTQPLDPSGWGIKLYTASKEDEKYIRKYDQEKDKNIVAQIVGVGDYAHLEKRFQIEKDQSVRIYALGEGRGDEMFDYAWIEDLQTGRTVWKMDYRSTRRAGGASKNRLFDGTVFLKAGQYIVHYISDDSHSYSDWNATPPRDKRNWGVTIYTYHDE